MNAFITVRRTGGTEGQVSVRYYSYPGSAGPGDYSDVNATLTFPVGDWFASLVGTLFPVLSEWVQGHKITVGPPFFNRVNVPVGLLLLLLAALGPLLAWRKTSVDSLKRNFLWPLTIWATRSSCHGSNALTACIAKNAMFAPPALNQEIRVLYTRILERELKTPKTFRSHKTTAMTTTAFKIDLMEPAIGM